LLLAVCAGCRANGGQHAASDAGAPALRPKTALSAALPAGDRKSASAEGPASVPAPPDVAQPPADAQRHSSGLITRVLEPGAGSEHPRRYDQVRVQYVGWKRDGVMFDARAAQVRVVDLIPGWAEAVELMVPGEKRRLWIPKNLAYGDAAPPKLPAGDLTFDVTLLEVLPRPQPPMDLHAPPKTARRTKSGLAFVVLKRGKDARRPGAGDRVRLEYSGWLPDGKLFDSTLVRKKTAELAVSSGIAGFTEGVQLMHVGETALFWFPANLAYGDKPLHGLPRGMLVFEIELLSIL
jgi:peptidylprolyl isomerase